MGKTDVTDIINMSCDALLLLAPICKKLVSTIADEIFILIKEGLSAKVICSASLHLCEEETMRKIDLMKFISK